MAENQDPTCLLRHKFAWLTTIGVAAVVITGMVLNFDPIRVLEFAGVVAGVSAGGAAIHKKVG